MFIVEKLNMIVSMYTFIFSYTYAVYLDHLSCDTKPEVLGTL